MYAAVVKVLVAHDRVSDFIAETRKNHEGTRREPGNLRFDVLRQEEDPAAFLLYEVYRTRDDFAAHQKTAHYLAWKAAVADWMARPREGVKYTSLFPDSEEAW